jgi:hypothetical protein
VTEFEDIHPDTLRRYYSTDGTVTHRPSHLLGAGHPSDEDDTSSVDTDDINSVDTDDTGSADTDDTSAPTAEHDSDDNLSDTRQNEDEHPVTLQEHLERNVEANINHPAIPVPRSQSPFNNPLRRAIFSATLDQVRATGIIPDGYHVLATEWNDSNYPAYESIRVGCRGKNLVVELPEAIWLPRAIAWAQGLHIMQTMLYQIEDSG